MKLPVTKPCPFCGGTKISIGDGTTFRWVVAECDECMARTGDIRINTMVARDEAIAEAMPDIIKEWDTRAY